MLLEASQGKVRDIRLLRIWWYGLALGCIIGEGVMGTLYGFGMGPFAVKYTIRALRTSIMALN